MADSSSAMGDLRAAFIQAATWHGSLEPAEAMAGNALLRRPRSAA